MPPNPRQMATGPQGRVWERIADLDRELRQIREGRANQMQHAYAENLAGVSGISTQTTLCSVQVDIPTADHRVLMSASATYQMSNNTTTWALAHKNDVEFPGAGDGFMNLQNTTAAYPVGSFTFQDNGTPPQIPLDASFFYNPFGIQTAVFAPTPGIHNWDLVAVRVTGTATLTATNCRLWVAVL